MQRSQLALVGFGCVIVGLAVGWSVRSTFVVRGQAVEPPPWTLNEEDDDRDNTPSLSRRESQTLPSSQTRTRPLPVSPGSARNNQVSVIHANASSSDGSDEQDETVKVIDLNKGVVKGSVLVVTPMRNTARTLDRYFQNLQGLDYDKSLMSLAFLVGDSNDGTFNKLNSHLQKLSGYRRKMIVLYDTGFSISADMRHEMGVQGQRRKNLARIRNTLFTTALQDEEWVLWMDTDVASYPSQTLKKLISYDKDIIVPNVVLPGGRQTYDLNSWQDTEASLKMKRKLDQGQLLLEGYPSMNTHRKHIGDFKNEIVKLDGVGGAVLLIRAKLHRHGLNFPSFVFDHQLETEGLARMAKAMGSQAWGLPKLHVIHH